MHVISFKRLREFASTHKDAGAPLRAWYSVAKNTHWQNLAEVKKVYPAADLVGRYTVFNIKGNKYRLITRVVYRTQTVFIIQVLTHQEYNLGKWKE